MDQKELCKWLRDNSSGVYRPSAQAAHEIERLQAACNKASDMAHLIKKIHDKLEYGDVYQWDDGDECWDRMRDIAGLTN
jgi:hypothetical protein